MTRSRVRIDKPWGFEFVLAVNERYAMKEIFLREHTRSSLQSHAHKMESVLVIEGSLLLELEDENGSMSSRTVSAGDSYDVHPRRRHRVTALSYTRLVEVSSPELDDIVRHEDDYGRA